MQNKTMTITQVKDLAYRLWHKAGHSSYYTPPAEFEYNDFLHKLIDRITRKGIAVLDPSVTWFPKCVKCGGQFCAGNEPNSRFNKLCYWCIMQAPYEIVNVRAEA
jgi:hypothetical protein